MKKKFIDTLGEFLLKILIFGAIMFFVGEYSKDTLHCFLLNLYWTIIICGAFYGLFIHDIIYKEEQKEDERREFLYKYIQENYVKKKQK